MSDRFDPVTEHDAPRSPARVPTDDFIDPASSTVTSRLPGIVISLICVAAVCVLATWPRWHPAMATIQLSGSDAAQPAADPARPDSSAETGVAAPSRTANLPSAATASTGAVASPTTTPQQTTTNGSGARVPATETTAAPAPGSAAPDPATAKREAARRPTLVRVPVTDDVPATWKALSPAQQDALQPFADQWARLSDLQKRKWIAIASVYSRMSPDAQQRLHARMLRWAQMTPDQRRLARENYEMSRVLPPGARQQAWRAYEALPPAQRAKFAAAERRRQPLVVSAPPSEPHRTPRHGTRPLAHGTAASGATAQGAVGTVRHDVGQDGKRDPAAHTPPPANTTPTPATAQTVPTSEPSVDQH